MTGASSFLGDANFTRDDASFTLTDGNETLTGASSFLSDANFTRDDASFILTDGN